MKKILTTAAAVAIAASAASAQDVTLRIQTHYASEHPSGVLAAQFADDVQVMSGGEIAIEMFYSSSVVATTETFDAAINGILDCDMTGGAYQTAWAIKRPRLMRDQRPRLILALLVEHPALIAERRVDRLGRTPIRPNSARHFGNEFFYHSVLSKPVQSFLPVYACE